MRGPRGCCAKVPLHMHRVHADTWRNVGSTGSRDFRTARGIGTALTAAQNSGRDQYLWAVADRSNRFLLIIKMPDDFKHSRIQPQIFWRTAAGNYESVVHSGLDRSEIGGDREAMAGLFAVRLSPVKVVNGCDYRVARRFLRADCIHLVGSTLQNLERHHGFVVFNVVTNDHQDSLGGHEKTICEK